MEVRGRIWVRQYLGVGVDDTGRGGWQVIPVDLPVPNLFPFFVDQFEISQACRETILEQSWRKLV